jgi:hypothetical protein
MLEELERRNYSEGTTWRYLRFVERFAQQATSSRDPRCGKAMRVAQRFTAAQLYFAGFDSS